jgi:hypothetical protein
MKVFIQSKSGNFNTVWSYVGGQHKKTSLGELMRDLRADGGYYSSTVRYPLVFVPFEEIEYVRKINDEDLTNGLGEHYSNRSGE